MKKGGFVALQGGEKVLPMKDNNGSAFTIVANYGKYVSAVKVLYVSNPSEWISDNGKINSISELQVGDAISHKAGSDCYVVTSLHGNFVLAVQTICIKSSEAEAWKITVRPNMK